MENVIVIFILLLAVGGALGYIIKAKKKGQKCIGCPYAKECTKCNCHAWEEESDK